MGLGPNTAPCGQIQSSGSRPGLCWHARVSAFSLELLLGRVKPHTDTLLCSTLLPEGPARALCAPAGIALCLPPGRAVQTSNNPVSEQFLHPARLHLLPSCCHFPCQSLLCSKGGCLLLMNN